VNLICHKDSPFSDEVKDLLRSEFEDLRSLASRPSQLQAAQDDRQSELEEVYGGKFFGRWSRSEDKQRRPFVTKEIRGLRKRLEDAGMTKGSAAKLAARTLRLICPDWHPDTNPERARKR
jgi:hypothetical protein